ncbi:triose-phosphate isomerase [Candidiatus Paracoxiella cheracis]|uniref:triose-phosphate isomerase n=1 Tax=Candidiatus Paracoxiella cheracis TaxID=3405120 RepID=UPI003BF5B035
MRRPFVAGNWKMNGSKESTALLLNELVQGCERVELAELAVFPPFVFLGQCEQVLMRTQISWGAQNVSNEPDGAFTGEISASMLHDFNCRYVIVGHSERRTLYDETNELVAAKFKAALDAEIRPVLCVGETEKQRDAEQTLSVVSEQLAAVLHLHDNLSAFADAVIAYEPVWAIGTGKHATPEQAQEVHAAIREQLRQRDENLADSVRILYGGSVKPDNAEALFAMPDIDGALVGGASLHAEQFLEIGKLCNN